MKKILIGILLINMLIVACKKNESKPPVVQIESPIQTDSFYVTDSIPLQFTISDKNLKSYKIILSNKQNGRIYYREEGNTNTTDYNVAKKIYAQVQADTTVLLYVLGLDKNENTGSDSVSFKLKK